MSAKGCALGVAQSMPESIPLPEVPAAATLEVYETASLAPGGDPSLVGEIQYTAAIEEPTISDSHRGDHLRSDGAWNPATPLLPVQ